MTGAVRSGSGETVRCLSQRHTATKLSRCARLSPPHIIFGSDKLAETEKSRQNGFVGYGAVFFKRTGRFFEGTPPVGSNDIFIIEIPPRASPDLLSLDPNWWQKTPLFTLSHTELSYQLYTSFHTAAESAEFTTQLSLTASSTIRCLYASSLDITTLNSSSLSLSSLLESLGLGLRLHHHHLNALRHKFDHYVFLIKPWVYTLKQPHLYRQSIIKPLACIFGTQLQLATHRLPTLQLVDIAPQEQRATQCLRQRRRPIGC